VTSNLRCQLLHCSFNLPEPQQNIVVKLMSQELKPEIKPKEDKSPEQLTDDLKSKHFVERTRTICHEFNNLLSVILGNNELVMANSEGLQKSLEWSREIKIAGLKALDLVNEMSSLARQNDPDPAARPGVTSGGDEHSPSAPEIPPARKNFSAASVQDSVPEAAPAQPPFNPGVPAASGCLLLIEDDAQLRKLFALKLSRQGYRVLEARDGKEGVDLFIEAQPDLVITDLIMPEKEGIETIIEIKRSNPEAKIIAVSGGGRNHPDDYLEVAKALGADTTFSKPVHWPDLLKTIKELLA
jgi:CheY-like chemotaxis protein